MNIRTYSRDDWFRAKAEWQSYGPRWAVIRREAAERGMIFPPSGTAHDDRNAAEPSQRSIVWRALEEQPTELLRIIRRSRSWSQVVDAIFGLEDRLREDAGLSEQNAAFDKAEERAQYRGRMESIGEIMGRWRDSVA